MEPYHKPNNNIRTGTVMNFGKCPVVLRGQAKDVCTTGIDMVMPDYLQVCKVRHVLASEHEQGEIPNSRLPGTSRQQSCSGGLR